jgi:hypothetical protein
MNEDIIRSTKEHEVTIPEGSINAKSKSGMVNMTAIEPEHRAEAVQENLVTNRRIAIDDDSEPEASHVVLPTQEGREENRAHLAGEASHDHAVELATEGISDHHVVLPDVEAALPDPNLVPTLTTEVELSDLSSDTLENSQDVKAKTDPTPQVVAAIADKWHEEYAGRVVKLREEVELLNHRLDHLEK